MSVISSIADLLLQANAIPSIEASVGRGLGFNAIVENLRARLPEGTQISQQLLGQAISRVRRAQNIGAEITAGRGVSPRTYEVDPTLPSGTEFRYRVAVNIEIPAQFPNDQPRTIRTVVPIDSSVPLTFSTIRDMIEGVVRDMGMRDTIPGSSGEDILVSLPRSTIQAVQVISAYRQAVR